MSRFLFVVPPLVGHVNPTVGVAAALTAAGHEVAWVGLAELVQPLVGPAAQVFPAPMSDLAALAARTERVRGPAALKLLWRQFLVPLAEASAPAVRQAARAFRPDVLVVDQQAFAGALVADELGIPWATSATTTAELTAPLTDMPLVDDWLRAELTALRERITGRPADAGEGAAGAGEQVPDPRFSPYLILVFSTAELTGPLPDHGGVLRMVGPCLSRRPAGDFPWDWLDCDRPTILISLGTVSADSGDRFLAACRAAVAERPGLSAVLVDPLGGDRPPAGNLLARREVPQLALLPRMRAVLCHAGHNTVCESLWHGVPLVVAPIRDDQPIVAGQVVNAGAGIRLRFTRADAGRIGAAIDTVLSDPQYAVAARRVGAAFRRAGGARAAAGCLATLAASTPTISRTGALR